VLKETTVPISPIVLQRRQTEVGRIRLGQKVTTKSGGQAPAKLDRLRFTSPSRELIDQVAKLYGGTAQQWTPEGGAAQWEVVTDTAAIPVIVPPQPVTQWFELWSGGGCQRRCDGQREVLSDQPCPCGPDPAERKCKPTTRLNLMLAEVPGIGVWRLESHGYYAATELGGLADLVESVRRPVPARLELQQRTVKRTGEKTRQFAVPVLHFDFIPGQLLAIDSVSGSATPALTGNGDHLAIEAAPGEETTKLTPAKVLTLAKLCRNPQQLRNLWNDAKAAGILTEEIQAQLTCRAEDLGAPAKPKTDDMQPASEIEDPATVWVQVIAAAAEMGMDKTSDVVTALESSHDVTPDQATAEQLRAFLAELQGGKADPR
jgi:hypothetical protein